MNHFVSKNDRQVYFNQIKGAIEEFNDGDKFCSITIRVGHETTRFVNFSTLRHHFEQIRKDVKIGDKVTVIFYLSSRNKNNRWYTMAIVLDVIPEEGCVSPV